MKKVRLSYEIWQDHWQDISLNQIAREKHLKSGELAKADFYDLFYQKLKKNNYQFQIGWFNDKRRFANWLKKSVDNLAREMNKTKPKCLSIGCGIGIIEELFIREGYDIELQECQDSSFEYLEKQGYIIRKKWITSTLEELPSDTFDIIWANSIMYCMEDEEYIRFSQNIARILKPTGRFIMIDTAAQWKYFLNEKRKKICKLDENKGVYWGIIRSLKEHERLLKNFFIINETFWLAKKKDGIYRKCHPNTTLGFCIKQYENADIVFEAAICEKRKNTGKG